MNTIENLLRDPSFRVHLIVFVAVNMLLFVIDMLTSPGTYWFQWPLFGWGIGILGHAFLAHRAVRQKQAATKLS